MSAGDTASLPSLLASLAAEQPDAIFLIDGERRFGFAQFRADARRLAKSLHALGVRRGDRVAILMGNRAEWLLVDFAVTTLGATLVALNTWWKARELHHALTVSGAAVLIMADRYHSQDFVAEIGAMNELPALGAIVCLGGRPPPGWLAPPVWAAPPVWLAYDELVAMGEDVTDAILDAAERSVREDDPAYILFTSGSTARAKAVPLLHGGLVRNMRGIGARLHLGRDDRLLMVVSLFWSFGCANALLAIMTHGGSVVLAERFDPAETLALIEHEHCTVLYAMPNMATALETHPDRPRRDLSRLRTGITLPSAVPVLASMGIAEITSCYGLTEGYGNSMVTDCKAPLEKRARTSGLALPGTEVEIVDPETRAPVARGVTGEIRVRGFVTPGYLDDPEASRAAIDRDGWFYSGDLGWLEPDGHLRFVGRLKELIKTGGINVAPAEVEEVLHAHPSVRQAIVVGLPDPERDEVLAALVVLKDGAATTADELRRHCRALAAAYKTPRVIRFVVPEEVPLTDTGKVSRRLVRKALLET